MKELKRTARMAGLFYLILMPLGAFGILYIPSTFIVDGDIMATIQRISENETMFLLAIFSALVTQLVQIAVVLYLYKLFKGVDRKMALFMVISILVAVPIAMLNELNHLAVVHLYDQPQLVQLFLELHEYGVFIAQIFWGIWLFPMGYLAYKSGFIPKWIGVLLYIACFGYLIDSAVYLIHIPFPFVFSDHTYAGEVAIVLWLLIKGVRTKKIQNEA